MFPSSIQPVTAFWRPADWRDPAEGLGNLTNDVRLPVEGGKGLFLKKNTFKDFTYYRNETHGAIVGKDLWVTSLYIGHIMAKRQSVGTTAVVGGLANSFDKGSATTSVPSVGERPQNQPLYKKERTLFVLCSLSKSVFVWILESHDERTGSP